MEIHKGSNFKKVILNRRMLGYKFGLFVITRKPFFFPIKVKKKKNNFLNGTIELTGFK